MLRGWYVGLSWRADCISKSEIGKARMKYKVKHLEARIKRWDSRRNRIGSYFKINEKEGPVALREVLSVAEGWINWIAERFKTGLHLQGCLSSPCTSKLILDKDYGSVNNEWVSGMSWRAKWQDSDELNDKVKQESEKSNMIVFLWLSGLLRCWYKKAS